MEKGGEEPKDQVIMLHLRGKLDRGRQEGHGERVDRVRNGSSVEVRSEVREVGIIEGQRGEGRHGCHERDMGSGGICGIRGIRGGW